jgi:hypothetical protein
VYEPNGEVGLVPIVDDVVDRLPDLNPLVPRKRLRVL